ncbi:hypothetical protein [Cohnella mopanensis]|uniref:hypothetical protein n=1 Tax=Cohnella mopanensis TaxID=2911966 RepID=UPI001EF95A88|nr:hypothetical protein [Cohnella mopanensis]
MTSKSRLQILWIFILACLMLSGCNRSSQASGLGIADISDDDLDVNYNGIILNDQISLEELTSNLHLSIEEDNESIFTRVAGEVNGIDYAWYQVSYPNKEQTDFIFDYLYNATNKSGRIVSIELKNVPTKRGIIVGDSLEKIKLTYGNNLVSETATETTNDISLLVKNKEIRFTYEKRTGNIVDIFIDYDSNKAMEEMDIPSLED